MHICHLDYFLIDYYTCLGVIYWATSAPPANVTPITLQCARHDCSCTAHDIYPPGPGEYSSSFDKRQMVFSKVTSSITIDGKLWQLPAPPLTIDLASTTLDPPIRDPATLPNNAIDFWADAQGFSYVKVFNYNAQQPHLVETYWNNGTVLDEQTIRRTGRCVSEDAYLWGFSSLLLLTFCSATIAFAIVSILLQSDVYWNSRHDRYHQSHCLYADVLYLAKELKAAFGRDIKDNTQSPRALHKQVERQKQGLRLDVHELPMSRWQERKILRVAKAAARKEGAATEFTGGLTHELRALSARDAEQGAESLKLHEGPDSAVHEEGQVQAAERANR